MLSNEDFFDGISGFYDEMISFDNALINRRKVLAEFISTEMKSAADLGCGTGLDSLSLALNGLDVTSFDLSQGMLDSAKEKAKQLSLNISFHKYSLADIPDVFNSRFDFAVSLGNTLANLNEIDIAAALNKVFNILNEKGVLLLQILNYKAIRDKNDRIINITGNDEKYFVRFYDFLPDRVNFNILTFNKKEPMKRELVTTPLYPHSHKLMADLLKKAGFRNLEVYGNLGKSGFDESQSKDLVILAKK